MRTNLSAEALADPAVALSNDIIRTCVHCGICLSHCPTYQVRHDENDSPRGRIILIRNMLEENRAPDEKTVKHLDRCLTCLACEAICPSGVQYSKLIAHGREHIEQTYRRPLIQRVMRAMLTVLLPNPRLFRIGLLFGMLARPLRAFLKGPLGAMLQVTPTRFRLSSGDTSGRQVFPAQGKRRARVCLLSGCVQKVLEPSINEATIRLLQRHGVEVVIARGSGCCGAVAEHMGLPDKSLPFVKANIEAWLAEQEQPGGLDAIIINASGCGTSVKAYAHALRDDVEWQDKAARVSALAKDITEFMTTLGLQTPQTPPASQPLRVAYHAACSMQHGQHIVKQPIELLQRAGFEVVQPADSFMCCGSAGVYNILQPELASELKARKIHNIRATRADVAASGNIGCMTQLADEAGMPFVHTVELLDWATGGPIPSAMREAAVEAQQA
ncbi:glycolate oxidase iron-sulfur subunit [Paraburkholderia sp. GAS199]|uniref:glycolate oxidase subunit GlcF n=1 Tax=Paraburkholderia sp. GAS199 TaxID=3035126 RepID=UPI003D20A5C1